ncbi:MAG: CNP1-like family protein [Burkholderiales bacterium]
MRTRTRPIALLVLSCAMAGPVAAQWAGWDYDFDEEKKAWKEIQAQIPAYPKPDDLIRLEIGGAARHAYFVDAKSISRGEDGVMRYTAMIKTEGGATNVTFEGMRCETREHKIYAVGRNDGAWVRARAPKWGPIKYRENMPHYNMLFREYFCPSRSILPAPKEVVAALRRGTPLESAARVRD